MVTTLINQNIPMVIAGDFNCIIGPHEKKGRSFVNDLGFKEFKAFIQSYGLVDLRFIGFKFIWYNNRLGGGGQSLGED